MQDDFSVWLCQKLQVVAGEYRKGKGYGDICESQYLCYLECLVAARGLDPAGMWDAWKQHIREVMHLPEGEPVLALNRQLGDDREALLRELEAFKRRWAEGPSPHGVISAAQLTSPPPQPPDSSAPPKLGTGRPEKPAKVRRTKVVSADDELLGMFGK